LRQREALAVYSEILSKIQTHYVDQVAWRDVYLHGLETLMAGLEDPKFVAINGLTPKASQLQQFRTDFYPQAQRYRVTDRGEAYNAAAYCAYIAEQKLGVTQSAALLEFTSGAMGALDEYSGFLTGNQLDEVFSQIEGNFVGLGVELKSESQSLLIVNVIDGGPAHQAGMTSGDRIIAVNGQTVAETTPDSAADMLKGEEGSFVDVVIERSGGEKRNMRLTRRRVEVPSVENVRMLDSSAGVGYLKLTSFQKTTSRDIDAALWALHRQGMRVLVIDLRGNPGGLLTSSVEIADKFLKDGAIVSTRGRSASEDYDYRAHSAGTWGIPLIVLIDAESASASEIFAGAIHDQRRGVIVGQRSFGKGSVQGIFPLQGANAGVRITTAKFYSPSGQPISKRGVSPDVVVQSVARPLPSGELLSADTDPVLKAGLQVAREQLSQR
jgi:carboxyl-terminal processing protease